MSTCVGGFGPLAAIHREQRELGLGVDDGVGVAELRGYRRTSPRTRCSAWSTSPSEQERLGQQEQRRVAPRAPRRLVRRPRSCASAIICSGRRHRSTARNIARAESNDAEPSSGTASNDAASTIAAHRCGLGRSARSTPRSSRRARRAGGTARCRSRRAPRASAARWTCGRRCRWGGRSSVTSCTHRSRSGVFKQVLERRGRGSIGLVPVGRSQVQLGDRARARPGAARRAGTPGTTRGSGTTPADGRAG